MHDLKRTWPALRGAALLLVLAHPAAAQTENFSFINDTSDTAIIDLSNNGGASYFDAYAGEYKGSLNSGPQINIFCTDINHEIMAGDTYTADTSHLVTDAAGPLVGSYYNGGLASAMTQTDFNSTGTLSDSARASEIAYLSDTYLGATASTFKNGQSLQDNLAGVNLAIWDIAQDGGGGSLGTGQVRVGGTDASLYTGLADSFEDQAAAHEDYTSQTADWIQAPVAADGTHKQDYVTTAAVPEPATLPLLSIGLAGIAVWAYKRRTSAA